MKIKYVVQSFDFFEQCWIDKVISVDYDYCLEYVKKEISLCSNKYLYHFRICSVLFENSYKNLKED